MNPLFQEFMGTVASGGLTNPFGLAAVAATGKHESSFSPRNAFGTWSDPSERGEKGISGGIMSWRNERLNNLRNFAAKVGDDPRRPSAATQAKFFLNEDPNLVNRLQNARSVEEAQRAINNAWRFAGYNRPGGEAAARLDTARQFAGAFGGNSLRASGNASLAQPMAFASAQPQRREDAPTGERAFGAAFGDAQASAPRQNDAATPAPEMSRRNVPGMGEFGMRGPGVPSYFGGATNGMFTPNPSRGPGFEIFLPPEMRRTPPERAAPSATQYYGGEGYDQQFAPTPPAVPDMALENMGEVPFPPPIAEAPAPRQEPAMPQQQPYYANPDPVWLDPAGVGPDQTIGETFGRLVGGLGGLGGTQPQPAQYASGGAQPALAGQQAPQSPASLPVGGSMPTPQAGAGGAPAAAQGAPQQQGGAGGFFRSEGFGNFLQALGASLMTSPRNAPLSGFPQAFQALQAASQARTKSQAEQQAIFAALKFAAPDAPDGVLRAVAVDSSGRSATIVLDAIKKQQEIAQAQQAREEFFRRRSGEPPASPEAAPVGVPAMPGQPEPQPVQQDAGGAERPAPAAATPASFDTGNRTMDGLLARRARLVEDLFFAPDEFKDAIKAEIAQADAEIDRFKPTSSQKDYYFDMQQRMDMGEPTIPFAQWDAEQAERRRPQNIVDARNMGNIPAGWQLIEDRETGTTRMEPIPGGPVDREMQEAERQAEGRRRSTRQAGGTVVQDLGRALEMLSDMNRGEGVVGANIRVRLAQIPGTVEYNINAFKESALSNVGLDTLQRMRENSPTGGALGQVPIQQQARLEQVLGSLDLGQRPDVIEDNMKRVMNIYTDIMYGDPGERALAVEQGRMTQEESDAIDRLYHNLSFDERGRRIERDAAPDDAVTAPPSEAIEILRSDPTPERRRQFDEIFGAGAAERELGGR